MPKSVFRNLKSNFIFFTGLIILTSVILISLFLKNYKNQNNTFIFNQNIQKISVDLKQLNTAVLNYKYEKHSDNFYNYKKDRYSDKVYYYINLLKSEFDNLNRKKPFNNFDISVNINESYDYLNEFDTDFKLLNENILKLGNSKNGLTENIILTEQKTDKILKEYPLLYNLFQKLKKAKIDLLANGNEQTEELFLKLRNIFLENLKLNQSIFGNVSEKQIVIDNTAEWLNNVIQFSKLQKINGTTYYTGLYNNLEILIKNTEKNLFDINNLTLAEQKKQTRTFFLQTVFLLLIFTISFILIALFIFISVKKQISAINNQLIKLIPNTETNNDNKQEFEKTKNLISQLIKDSENKTEFVKQLKLNKFSEIKNNFSPNDRLGNTLIDLKNYYEKKNEEQKKEEEMRAISDRHKDGIVKFGKIIRQHLGNIDELTFNLLKELVHFLNADIGGIYVIDKKNHPEFLILKASYAYDEKKLISDKIQIGVGLVGTCAADKSSIFIDKIDDDYIKIVSGFGHTKPKSLLLSPIFVKNEIYGVIELASSRNFTEHDIKFTETLSEDIAYTLSYFLK